MTFAQTLALVYPSTVLSSVTVIKMFDQNISLCIDQLDCIYTSKGCNGLTLDHAVHFFFHRDHRYKY